MNKTCENAIPSEFLIHIPCLFACLPTCQLISATPKLLEGARSDVLVSYVTWYEFVVSLQHVLLCLVEMSAEGAD